MMNTLESAAAGDPAARPPFAHLGPVIALAGCYGIATLSWAVAGNALPGGRWLAVHLFTLGVLSNLVLAMTEHFSFTLTRVPGDQRAWLRLAVFNVGALGVLVGLPTGWRVPFLAGAVVSTAAVLWLYLALRRMRKRALGARFAFVVRAYERATAAFLHGAALGALLGVGVLAGGWYSAVRVAHLSVNILGWGGLVLLATVVFFGPTLMRTKMAPHAQRLAVPALRHGATALSVGVVALIVTGADGTVGLVARVVAVIALAGYAAAVTAVCVPVVQAARRAVPSAHGRMIAAACVWFPLAIWAGVAVLATDAPRLLDGLGLVLLVGVLGQAILGAWTYLLPMVAGRGPAARTAARVRLERFARLRPAAYNAGVGMLSAAHLTRAAADVDTAPLAAAAWGLLVATVATTLLLAVTALAAARAAAGAPVQTPSEQR